jgi:integrase/recombinase XerD
MTIPQQFEPLVQDFTGALKLRGYSPTTVISYVAGISAFLVYVVTKGVNDLREVTSATVRNYQLQLLRSDYSPWTVMLRLQAVRRFFDHLESAHSILLNPCGGLKCGKAPDRLPKRVLTVEEARQVLQTPSARSAIGIRDRAILEVFYSSGLRLQEMSRLSLDNLDLKNGFLRVNHGKGARDRVVPLGQGACQALAAYVEKTRQEWVPVPGTQKALWLASSRPHGPLKSQAIEVMVRRYGRLAGLSERLTPHVWRHTCATHLVAAGASIAYVQRLLGHVSLRTTQMYVRTTIPEIKAMHDQAHPRNHSNPI